MHCIMVMLLWCKEGHVLDAECRHAAPPAPLTLGRDGDQSTGTTPRRKISALTPTREADAQAEAHGRVRVKDTCASACCWACAMVGPALAHFPLVL